MPLYTISLNSWHFMLHLFEYYKFKDKKLPAKYREPQIITVFWVLVKKLFISVKLPIILVAMFSFSAFWLISVAWYCCWWKAILIINNKSRWFLICCKNPDKSLFCSILKTTTLLVFCFVFKNFATIFAPAKLWAPSR